MLVQQETEIGGIGGVRGERQQHTSSSQPRTAASVFTVSRHHLGRSRKIRVGAGQQHDVGYLSSNIAPLTPTETSVVSPDDGERFRLLFEAGYRPLVAFARRRCVDWAEADDVVGETFTVAWRRRQDLDPDVAPLPWLYGIAGNIIRNQQRAGGRRLRLIDKLETEHRPNSESDPSDRPGAEVRAALAQLAPDDQEVLRLTAWEGLPQRDVAQLLGCSTNAVALRLRRARQRLRDELGPEPPLSHQPR